MRVVVVVVLRPYQTAMELAERSTILTILFLGRLISGEPKQN